MEWMHTLLHSQVWLTARSIICALWPLQLLAVFFACCELVWFARSLTKAHYASRSNSDASLSGICSSGLDHTTLAAARLIAGNDQLAIADVLEGNAHQRRLARRRIARGREIL